MAVMNEPILRETWKMRWANCPVAIELDAHRCVLGLSLQLQRSALKLVHRFLFDFDVPVEGRFVAALEEINVREVREDDLVEVRPFSQIPVDGDVIEGEGLVVAPLPAGTGSREANSEVA